MKNKLENIAGLLVVIIIFSIVSIVLIAPLIISSNKYEDYIAKLELENKKKEHQITQLKKDSKEKDSSIEDLQAKVDGKKSVECDCGFYEDFYYEHAEELGALE